MADLKKLYDSILNGDAKAAEAITKEALAEKVDVQELIQKSMVPAMDEVGKRFQCEEFFVPELLLAGRAMKAALSLLEPHLAEQGVERAGRVVIGTVKGDLHDIGKNLVATLLEGGGFEVTDLGVDVTPEQFVEAVREKQPHIVGLSALLTVTMHWMTTTIEALEEADLRDNVSVFVGGAPLTAEFAEQIGADGYAEDAGAAVALARQLVAR